MANTNKTKAEILQELESIKGLLLEDDDIPILQELEDEEVYLENEVIADEDFEDEVLTDDLYPERSAQSRQPSVLPGQTSLFDEPASALTKIAQQLNKPAPPARDSIMRPLQTDAATLKNRGFTSYAGSAYADNRPLAKASGENPFLPQHIRERLHGNNPPPLFEYEAAKKIIRSTKTTAPKTSKPRQYLIEEVMLSMMPQIEIELRHRLFAMSVEDLERLLTDED